MHIWNKHNNFFKFSPEEYYIKITAQRNVCINFWLAMSEKISDLTVPLKAHHKQGDYTLSWCSSLLGPFTVLVLP